MYPLIKVREVTASKIYLLKIALSSLVRIIWAKIKKKKVYKMILSLSCLVTLNKTVLQKQNWSKSTLKA